VWARVLGSAAGGGFPQWNCNCPNCRGARDGSLPCRSRTQSSIAISIDRERWFLLNASPDLRGQIAEFSALWPRNGVRHTPIQAVVLTDAELDHTLGLVLLREGRYVRVYSTDWVRTALTEWNPLLRTLSAYCTVDWRRVDLGRPFVLNGPMDEDSGICCEAFSTSTRKPVAFAPEAHPSPESSVGFRLTDARTGGALVYLPAVLEFNAAIREQVRAAACVFIDGTCWDDDELARLGCGGKSARAMGHLPIGGADGSLHQLADLDVARAIYIHINNTNPILIEDSPERQAVEERGIEVAYDGMEVEI
jgi:pyrroloquinoline quinone biosynthesis protein B